MDISVVIPVGPYPHNSRWLSEAINSAKLAGASEVLLIDDQANLNEDYGCNVWKTPWLSGVAHAFNFGVALAPTECVFMLGSDDTIEPNCLKECEKAFKGDAYYSVTVKYMDTGEIQTIPCHAAMVTKGLWKQTGGFPIESAVGAPDAALLSIMMVHMPKKIINVAERKPLYNYRRHPETDTNSRAMAFGRPIIDVRHIVTERFVAK